MIFKPQSLTIRQEARTGSGGSSYGSALSFMGLITPMSQSKAAEDYGIVPNRPHLLMADATLHASMKIGALVSLGSRRFKVASTGAVYELGTPADHASCALEEVEADTFNA